MCDSTRKMDLSDSWKSLLELMQRIGFGWLMDLPVKHGDPVLDDRLRIVKVSKLGGENGPRPEVNLNDFVLKIEILEFIEHLLRIWNGTVKRTEIKHGLPFKIEEEIQP